MYLQVRLTRALKLTDFFFNFPSIFSTKYCFEKVVKLIGNHARLRDAMGQSYHIHACTRSSATHVRYSSIHITFCGTRKHNFFKKILGKKAWRVESVKHMEQ